MLANYTELQTEIADTLHRDDLTSKIPLFIKLFEKRLNRHLNIPQQTVTTDLTLAANTQTITLPSDMMEPLDAVIYIGNVPCELVHVTGEFIDNTMPISSVPTYFTINAGAMNFGVTANQNYTVRLRYVKSWDLATDNTNWLLTNNPDCYLYGALAASAPYIGDDERLALWQSLAAESIDEIKRMGAQMRKAPLLTEVQAHKGKRFNIVRGY
ncbi:MAG: hypothetical protein WC505_07945 [Patescibacteria group bacterium]